MARTPNVSHVPVNTEKRNHNLDVKKKRIFFFSLLQVSFSFNYRFKNYCVIQHEALNSANNRVEYTINVAEKFDIWPYHMNIRIIRAFHKEKQV